MPANEIHPSLSAFANGFKAGKHLDLKSYKDNEELFDLFDEFGNSHSVYLKESTELFPNLVELIEKGIDLRSIFLLMITLNRGPLAKDFLKCLEDNNIFFPIHKPYYSYISCPNFFAEIAALGEADVTKSLFQYGINGFKHKLKNDLSEKEKQEKIKDFAEELLAVVPPAGVMSTLEYVVSAVSPVVLMNEGFDNGNRQDKLAFGQFAYSETYYSKAEELETTYHLPWKTIKILTELGRKYKIDLTDAESSHIISGEKIFDILSKTDNKEVMQKLVERFVYPYSKGYVQDIELTPFGKNLENFYFCLDIDGMHYDKPSNVLIKISPKYMKDRCEAILASTPKISQDITERLDQQAAVLDQTVERVRRGSELRRINSAEIKKQAVKLQEHELEIKAIKVDIEDLNKASQQLEKIVKDNLADNLIFENIGDNPSLQRLYVGIRDSILKRLDGALKGKDGKRDEQMNLMLKNGAMVAGAVDFAAGFAGAPGVVGASFGVIAYACKYFEKLHEQDISENTKQMLLGSLDLPKLLAVGVAEALVLRAKENVHDRRYTKQEEKEIIEIVDNLIARQLSTPHLDKLFDIMRKPDHKYRKECDMFEELKRILLHTVAELQPYTHDLLEEEKALKNSNAKGLGSRVINMLLSSKGKKVNNKKHCANYHPHDPHEMVRELFKQPTKLSHDELLGTSVTTQATPTTPPSSYYHSGNDDITTISPSKDGFRLAGSDSSRESSGNENKPNYRL